MVTPRVALLCAASVARGVRGTSSTSRVGKGALQQAQGLWAPIERVAPRPRVRVLDTLAAARSEYDQVAQLQRDLVDARVRKECSDTLVLAEFEPVYTLGRGASLEHVLFDADAPGAPKLVRVERGGDVTYHGPGQLVAYPVLDLHDYRRDSHWYLRALEEVVIRTCARLGVKGATRHPEHTGVWCGSPRLTRERRWRERKFPGRIVETPQAASGVAIRRWVTYHGIALNVAPIMADYERIVPCGLQLEPVGSLRDFVDGPLTAADVAPVFLAEFADVFEADLHFDDDANRRLVSTHAAASGAL